MTRKKITTKEFIEKAQKIHGDKYNYSEVEYINSKTKVIIFCKKCNEYFEQSPNSHLSKCGCYKCGIEKLTNLQKSTTKEFIEKAQKIHKNKYDYSKVGYINNYTKVIIFCKKCKKYFKQSPNSHLRGNGCANCHFKKIAELYTSTTKDFIEKAKKIHGNKYDYSKVEYINGRTKVIIFCKKCKKHFRQKPNSHLRGIGCYTCGEKTRINKTRSTTEEFIKKAIKIHGDKYNYSEVEYINSKTKVIIFCKKCKKYFRQKPNIHLGGAGCPKCGIEKLTNSQKSTIKDFIEKAIKVHGDKYNYSEVKYINSQIKIIIFCKKCNEYFKQIPNSHLRGNGCPDCVFKNQNKIREFLLIYFPNFKIISQKFIYKYIGTDKKEHKRFCDFYLQKEKKIIIVEYDGQQHFKPTRFGGMSLEKAERRFIIQQYIDKKDAEFCKENNILLWRIKYNEDKEKRVLEFKKLLNNG